MTGLKKLHLLLVPVLLASAVASASTISDQARRHGGAYFQVEAFDARVGDTLLSSLPFAHTLDITGVLPSTVLSDFHYFKNDNDWGWHLAAGYDYPSCTCCNYGFSLEFTWFRSDDDKHLAGFINEDGEPVLVPVTSFFGFGATDVNASFDTRYHAIDLLGHQNRTFCNCVDVQFFAGARYVNFKENYDTHFFTPDDLADDVLAAGSTVSDYFAHHRAKFDGLGPRVGFNVDYNVYCGFGLFTELAGNLVFGRSDSDWHDAIETTDLVDGVATLISTGENFNKSHKNGFAVPGLSGKVALTYRTAFCNCSSLSVELGYRGDKYFGIANHSSLVRFGAVAANYIKDGNYHDFDVSGPYVAVTYHM